MKSTDIRAGNANHLRVTEAGGLLQISRIGREGDVIQALTVLPEELDELLAAMAAAKQEAA